MTPKKKHVLSVSMTEAEFDNGYWFASDLREFAVKAGIPSAGKMRKGELEKALKHLIRTGKTEAISPPAPAKAGVRDVDLGLALDLAIVNYTSNKETKQFIEREAARLEPGFKRASGTRYLLNRWREAQLAAGKRITYRDLVLHAIELNRTKTAPLRVEHGRYINFISDYAAANKNASHKEAVSAWQELKAMDAPKTYESWLKARTGHKARS